MKTLNTLDDLFWDQIMDIYHAENQLVKTLPKLAKESSHADVVNAIYGHLEETKSHVTRLEQIFEGRGKNPRSQKCEAMEGLLQEAKDTIANNGHPTVIDAAIICCAQKVEHYEIGTYGTLLSWARLLGYMDAADLLKQTLQEEKNADSKLTKISESVINRAALAQATERDEEEIEMAEQEEQNEVRAARPRMVRSQTR